MPEDEKLAPAGPQDLADSMAFALRFEERKRVHDADAFMGGSPPIGSCDTWNAPGTFVMKRPRIGGGGDNPGGRGFDR